MVILAGCVGPGRLPFESPKVVEYLDGNYRRLASCTHQQLGRQHSQLRMTDLRERRTVTISPPEAQWEFSFIDDDGGRQTRLEVTSANGTFPGEHALALGSGLRGVARACGQERAFQPGPRHRMPEAAHGLAAELFCSKYPATALGLNQTTIAAAHF